MALHEIVHVGFKPASCIGALDGNEAVCSCGYRMGTSLSEREALRLGVEHVNFMNAKEAVAS